MRTLLANNRNIIAATILATGIVAAPSAVSAAMTGTVTASGTGTASCPSGYRVTGGGFSIPSDSFSSSSSDEYKILSSAPSSATAWRVTATRVHGTYYSSSGWRYTSSSYNASVKAVCGK